MTRRFCLLSVATACLALLSMAAVATRAPETTDAALEGDDRLSPKGKSPSSTAAPSGTTATEDGAGGLAPAKPPLRASAMKPNAATGDGGTTATTGGASGSATTTTRGDGSKATTTTTRADGPKCPNPKTCDVYKLMDETSGGPQGGTKGWRPERDGTVRIRFYVNPTPPQNSGLTEDTMEEAHLRAASIIEAANPRVRYVYLGRTTRIPRSLDGFNDFAFGSTATVQHDSTGHIREADISSPQFYTAGDWSYTPCEQRDGGCGRTAIGKLDILTMIVHEMAHTTGLADLFGEQTTRLTMDSEPDSADVREKITLGLGDVLGIRALYPTSAPMPPIYAP